MPARIPTAAVITEIFRQCIDPEVGLDIVSLGLIYDVQVQEAQITVTMTLTTPSCPLGPYFVARMKEMIHKVYPRFTTAVTITFQPAWRPDMVSASGRKMLGR